MTITIDKKITDYAIAKDDEVAAVESFDEMNESIERPEMILGATYKIKTPLSIHALYITINDIVLNQGTSHEVRRPFEIFINSKNMDNFQWIVALTRIISAVFRKGGDSIFLVEELQAVFDPAGGYFKKGGKFMPSLVAELGGVLEAHFRFIGMIKDEKDERQEKFLNDKKAEFEAKEKVDETSNFPSTAELCKKCHTKALVRLDGCLTCLNCADSKCG